MCTGHQRVSAPATETLWVHSPLWASLPSMVKRAPSSATRTTAPTAAETGSTAGAAWTKASSGTSSPMRRRTILASGGFCTQLPSDLR